MSDNGNNLINNLLKTFKLIAVILTVVLTALIITSCPKPLDDKLIIEVQDEFAPLIIIASPTDDSYYYSSITITGTITDNAFTADDGLGQLSFISYTVANDVSRQGKVTIADDGSSSKDSSFGSGDIIYDSQTGLFNITFSAIEIDGTTSILQQRVTITITAADRNNNSTKNE